VETSLLEIRTYRLKPGSRAAFHRLVVEQSIPLLARFGVDMVRFGPSEVDEDGAEEYVLMRSFESAAARAEQEARFYSSDEWVQGPREDVLALIESYHTIVLTVPEAAVEGLRRDGAGRP